MDNRGSRFILNLHRLKSYIYWQLHLEITKLIHFLKFLIFMNLSKKKIQKHYVCLEICYDRYKKVVIFAYYENDIFLVTKCTQNKLSLTTNVFVFFAIHMLRDNLFH